jgi:hypothetical protein
MDGWLAIAINYLSIKEKMMVSSGLDRRELAASIIILVMRIRLSEKLKHHSYISPKALRHTNCLGCSVCAP